MITRQLKDIQVQAERLLSRRASMEEIREFHRYNEELKKYIDMHVEDEEILERISQVPVVLEETESQLVSKGIVQVLVTFLASPFSSYFHERQTIENARSAIRETRGKYSIIEFLYKSSE